MPKSIKVFCFKEVTEDGDLVTPHADGMEYEFPIDFRFDTLQKIKEFANNHLEEEWGVEPDESDDWVIVTEVTTIIGKVNGN